MEYLHTYRTEANNDQFVETEMLNAKAKEGWRHYQTLTVLRYKGGKPYFEFHYYFKRRKKFLGIF